MYTIITEVKPQTEHRFFIMMRQLGIATTEDGQGLSISTGGMNLVVNISNRQYLVPLQELCQAIVDLDFKLTSEALKTAKEEP